MWFEFLALAFFTRRANVALAPFVMVPEVLVETFVEVMRFKFVEEAFAPRLTWIRFWKVDLCLLLPFSNWFRTEDEEGAIELACSVCWRSFHGKAKKRGSESRDND